MNQDQTRCTLQVAVHYAGSFFSALPPMANILSFLIVTAVFAAIGVDASAHHQSVHSGTQEHIRK